MDHQPTDDEIRRQLAATSALFQPIRAAFRGPGRERGGHERPGVTPIYQKKYGEHFKLIYPEIERYSVESSFTAEQLGYVQAALVALRDAVVGADGGPALAERVTGVFLASTRPYFMAAMLKALEDALREVFERQPLLAAALDAIFRVAGSEGMRDLVRVYCAHQLEHALAGAASPMPDLLAFVDVHQREEPPAGSPPAGQPVRTAYEVWCPGTDLAKAIFRQCEMAATGLARDHGVDFAPGIAEEAGMVPEVTAHLTKFARACALAAMARYGAGTLGE
ncbi:MAG TPA: hypothetical protein VGE07_01840 [Herpetosiphonaceae bacterium]